MSIGVGLIGYGLAGEAFHAPLIAATPGFRLAAVMTSRADQVARAHPDATVHGDAAALIADPAVELVVIASPTGTHAELAEQALRAGKPVVVDKPLAASARDAEALIALAAAEGLFLSVFHNRRWDDDFLALADLVKNDTLGEIALVTSRFDRFRPQVQDRWREKPGPGAGIWWDLGSHLLDQALQLFGPPQSLYADLALQRPGAEVVDAFQVTLAYPHLRVNLAASSLMTSAPRFSVQGVKGSFVSHGMDGQEAVMRALPPTPREPPQRTATLSLWSGDRLETRDLTMPRGDWGRYYAGVEAALRGAGPNPVPAEQALSVIRGLELAEESHRTGRRLDWSF